MNVHGKAVPPCCLRKWSLGPSRYVRRCHQGPQCSSGFHKISVCMSSKSQGRGIHPHFAMISQQQGQGLTSIALLAKLGLHIDLRHKGGFVIIGVLHSLHSAIGSHFSCNIPNSCGPRAQNEKGTFLTTACFIHGIPCIFSLTFLLKSIRQIQQKGIFWMRFSVSATGTTSTKPSPNTMLVTIWTVANMNFITQIHRIPRRYSKKFMLSRLFPLGGWRPSAHQSEALNRHLLLCVFLWITAAQAPAWRCICSSVEIHQGGTFPLINPVQQAWRKNGNPNKNFWRLHIFQSLNILKHQTSKCVAWGRSGSGQSVILENWQFIAHKCLIAWYLATSAPVAVWRVSQNPWNSVRLSEPKKHLMQLAISTKKLRWRQHALKLLTHKIHERERKYKLG